MRSSGWAEQGLDLDRPSVARVHDYLLGGAHNFAVDRQLAAAITGITPAFADTVRASRAFLRRAVRFLIGRGITQFLDIGSGIPSVGNVHAVARRLAPQARVVCVDIDPMAVSHCRVLLAGDPFTAVVEADARDTAQILDAPEAAMVLDLEQPVAVMLLGVLDYLPDEHDPAGVLARLRDGVCPGSYFAVAGATDENQPPETLAAQQLLARTGSPVHPRSRQQLRAQLAGLTLVDPGLVHVPLWRPEAPQDVGAHPQRCSALGAVGHT